MPHTSLVGLYTLAIIGGIILSLDNPLRRSFVTEMVRDEDIPNAIVLYGTIVNGSRIFGPALAGLLVVTLGYGWCFAIDAASYIAVIICIFMMIQNDLHRQPLRPKTKGDVREGIRYVLSIPILWISFVMLAAIGTLSYNFGVTLPLFVINSLHGTVSDFTILYSVLSCGAVLSAFIFAKLGSVKINHIIFGAAALGLLMLLLALVSNVGIALPIIFLLGVASLLYLNSTTTIIQVGTKREMHGRLLALQGVFLIGTGVIGGPLMGWLADAMGARMPIALGGIVALISAILGYVAIKKYDPEKLLDIK
jgi:MFS family permease